MNETYIKTLIEKNLDSKLKCGNPIESQNDQPYWNYLLSTTEIGAIGSIDFVPSEKIIRVNTYSTTLTLSDTYKQDLEKQLNDAISSL